jgi:hypothetical protein
MNFLQRPFWIDASWLILLFCALLLRFRSTGLFCFKVFRRLFLTFLAAFMGAITAFVVAACYLGSTPDIGPTVAPIIMSYTAYAWIFFILPLTLWFEEESRIYYFRFSIPLGIALSLIALSLVTIRDISSFPRLFWPLSIFLVCPILFGIVVSITLSIFASFVTSSQKPAEQGAAANP